MAFSSPQDIVSTLVSSTLAKDDVLVNLYLKLRQDVLGAYIETQKELANDGEVSAKSKLRLEQLLFENDKMGVEYGAHIDRLIAGMKFVNKTPTSAMDKLEKKFDGLTKEKKELEEEILRLQDIQGPVVEKMHLLVKNYNKILQGKKLPPRRDGDEDSKDTELDLSSSTFSTGELLEQFLDLSEKFGAMAAKEGLTPREMLDIDIAHQLQGLMTENKAFSAVDDLTHRYNKALSQYPSVGDALVSVQEIKQAVDGLSSEVLELIAEAQHAKKNWDKNARLLELLNLANEDSMDVDPEENN